MLIFEKRRLKQKEQNTKKCQKENEIDEWSGIFLMCVFMLNTKSS